MADEVKKEEVKEKQTNCPSCNKLLKKIRRYYRNGKLYCTKRCWIKVAKTPKEEKAKE